MKALALSLLCLALVGCAEERDYSAESLEEPATCKNEAEPAPQPCVISPGMRQNLHIPEGEGNVYYYRTTAPEDEALEPMSGFGLIDRRTK